MIIEEAPFRTLGDVCAEKCTLLTYGDTETRWLASQNIALTFVDVIDLQQRYLRNDANLLAGSRYDEVSQCCVPTRDRRSRPIEQAMAMHRTSSDPLRSSTRTSSSTHTAGLRRRYGRPAPLRTSTLDMPPAT